MGHGRSDLGGLATTNLTYSAPWNSAGQVLVETPVVAVGGAYTEISRVWSPLYVDGLVGSDVQYVSTSFSFLAARFYVRQDANWNITSLAGGDTGTQLLPGDPAGRK